VILAARQQALVAAAYLQRRADEVLASDSSSVKWVGILLMIRLSVGHAGGINE
jgi:hypothetical protein